MSEAAENPALPKYLQIAKHFATRIEEGELPPGAEVPSERELAAQWGVARLTANKALRELRRLGLVETRPQSGSFVMERAVAAIARDEPGLHLGYPGDGYRWPALGATPDVVADAEPGLAGGAGTDPAVLLLRAGAEPAPDALRAEFTGAGMLVARIRLVRGASGVAALVTSWFAPGLAERAPLLARAEALPGGSGRYLAEVAGVRVAFGHDRVTARLASAFEREQLGLPDPAAVLVRRSARYTADGVLVRVDDVVQQPDRWFGA
ncbi:GntR family transcriptional regulator [Nocardia sp. NPDC057353]|uniref:GntR family transcriptional regulator n=1 Tax=Nocardia sp. NPDC057353 TaxID=3346104 RepID=UPI003629A34E